MENSFRDRLNEYETKFDELYDFTQKVLEEKKNKLAALKAKEDELQVEGEINQISLSEEKNSVGSTEVTMKWTEIQQEKQLVEEEAAKVLNKIQADLDPFESKLVQGSASEKDSVGILKGRAEELKSSVTEGMSAIQSNLLKFKARSLEKITKQL